MTVPQGRAPPSPRGTGDPFCAGGSRVVPERWTPLDEPSRGRRRAGSCGPASPWRREGGVPLLQGKQLSGGSITEGFAPEHLEQLGGKRLER